MGTMDVITQRSVFPWLFIVRARSPCSAGPVSSPASASSRSEVITLGLLVCLLTLSACESQIQQDDLLQCD